MNHNEQIYMKQVPFVCCGPHQDEDNIRDGQAKEDTRLFRIHISNNLNTSSIFLLESFLIPLTFFTEAGDRIFVFLFSEC